MIAFKYTMFALFATSVNLLCQFCVFLAVAYFHVELEFVTSCSIYIAIAFGTIAGLISKYILDKKYIFNDANLLKMDHATINNLVTFIAYTGTGVATTVIFWGTELMFDHFFSSPSAKYIGGALGLMIGYICKYQLDKKYVFLREPT